MSVNKTWLFRQTHEVVYQSRSQSLLTPYRACSTKPRPRQPKLFDKNGEHYKTEYYGNLLALHIPKLLAKRTRKSMQVNASLQNQDLHTDLRRVAKRIRKSARKFTQVGKK